MPVMQNSRPVIMTIDDDPVVLNFLVSILKEEYRVRPFTSGQSALDFLATQSADLILLDYRMPGLMGIDVLKELQADPRTREIPTIFLTSSVDSEVEVEALEFGAVDYIAKPIRSRSLLIRVKLQLELQAHRQQLEELVIARTKSLHVAYSKLKRREEVTLSMLAKATDMRDHATGGHIERTTEYVRIIATDIYHNPAPGYYLTEEEAEEITRSSKLHDLGKIALPDHILLKPERLTIDEFEIVKKHPAYGEQFLNEFVGRMEDSFLETARDIASAHHERWDGSGYPKSLKETEIPLSARIAAIADVYDALTSIRPYKSSISHEEAVEIVLENSGSHFDPYLTRVFARHVDEIKTVSELIADD